MVTATRYPSYRNTGYDWLPLIPDHWEVRRCRFVFREIDQRSIDGRETHLSMTQSHGLIPSSDMNTRRLKSASYAGGKLVRPGDLVLNRLKAHLGVFAGARQAGVISPDYSVFQSLIGRPVQFYEKLFKTPMYVGEFRRSTRGIVEGFWRLYTDDFYEIPALLPPPDEQDQIVVYLRAQDAKISRFIRDKRRLIELLNEQKKTLIHRAVTRGLDPNVRLRPSGVDWLGEVPEPWSVMPLKATAVVAFSGVDKLTEEGELPVLLCNYTDVYRNDQITSNLMFMNATATPHEIARFTLRKDDVLMTKDSETPDDIGVPAWVSEDLHGVVCGYHLAMLRPRPDVAVGAFLYRALCSPHVANQFHVAAAGVTRFGLAKRDISTAVLAVPPVAEQADIVKWLERETAELDKVIAGAKAEIALMREYRDRLIADVVTGQIDVRSWVPGPDDLINDSEVTLEIEPEADMDEQGDNDDDDGHE